jgi:hypothetical protein
LLCAEQVSGAKGHITPQMIEVWQCCWINSYFYKMSFL